MNRPEKNELLNEILGDADLSAAREASLTRALSAMRVRTRVRRQFQVAAVVTPLLLLALTWHFQRAQKINATVALTTTVPSAAADDIKVKFITAKELLALFSGRPVALIGEPGHQRFLLLDEIDTTGKQ